METSIIYKGKVYDVLAIKNEDRCYVADFIKGLEKKDQKKILALIKRIADYGILSNDEKFHKLEDENIWEFKSFQIRLFCFFDKASLVILTHGFIKKKNETPRTEIDRAVRFQREYNEAKKK